MKFQRKHIILSLFLLAICALIISVLGKGLKLNPNSTGNALLNKDAKEFSVEIVQADKSYNFSKRSTFTFEDLKGKPLVLNFWASWCVSCKTEAVEIEKFWRKHGDKVQVIGIAVHDSQEAAKGFIERYGKTYTIGLDLDGMAGINYGVTGVPETFFIDSAGKIRHKEAGPVDTKILEEKLLLIL